MAVRVDVFEKELTCIYKGERYSVRDNGAVLRHSPDNGRQRPNDNQWIFGKVNKKNGYLEIASERIHRIVATAFQGEPPTKQHVVDHIDTNRQNNRPENLRWVTRLENILLNPITVKRIELICGSVESFLDDPSKFRDMFQEPNYSWMCTVSNEEAQVSKERLFAWAKSDKKFQGGTIGQWIYNSRISLLPNDNITEYTDSLTPNSKQKNWVTLNEFPCCPKEIGENPIISYYSNLKKEGVFGQNKYSKSIIVDFAISKAEDVLWVMTRNSDDEAVKPYCLAEVTYKDGLFIHNSLGSFFERVGAEKQLTLAQGLEWTGGDSVDDFC